MGSKLDYYFFPKTPVARVLITLAGGGFTVFLIFYSHGIPGFLESFDPISSFLIRGVICIFPGILLSLLGSFIFNFFTRFFKK